MALEATHVKFALDLKDHFSITNEDAYLSGTMYPDSRYVTGISRGLTHDDSYLDPSFRKEDFNTGWSLHLLCDQVGHEGNLNYFSELCPEIQTLGAFNEGWMSVTALKILLDLWIVKHFDIKQHLGAFEVFEAPHGESKEQLTHYYKVVRSMYDHEDEIGLRSAKEMWAGWGVKPDILDAVEARTQRLQETPEVVSQMPALYAFMLKKGRMALND